MTRPRPPRLPRRNETPLGYALTGREPARRTEALAQRFGRSIWDGGDGAPALNREGADPRRPWM